MIYGTQLFATIVPIVTVEENNRLEDLADGTGVNEWRFMTNSGLAVALEAEKLLDFDKSKSITILVGKGYKGGNALWGGYLLLQRGYSVKAYLLVPVTEEWPSICGEIISMFKDSGGDVDLFDATSDASTDLIIDGLVGTGFKGGAKGRLAEMIMWANNSRHPILAVDIPSGLNGNTGKVETVAVFAKHTIAISFPKIGLFICDGNNYVGTFSTINIGLDDEILALVQPEAYLISTNQASKYLNLSELIKLDRDTLETYLRKEGELTFQDCQRFSEENQMAFILTDTQLMIFTPLEKPMIIDDNIIQYKINEGMGIGIDNYISQND